MSYELTSSSLCYLLIADFAGRLLETGITPRNGNKSDQAHPPIHPTKYADNLTVSTPP